MVRTPAEEINRDLHRVNTPTTRISKVRFLIFVSEISLVALLLSVWLVSDGIRQSRSLWILFLYSFPSQFLIATVPHEPVYLYFSKFYAPLLVTMVSVSSTVLTELINYSTFQFIVDLKSFHRIRYSGLVQKLIDSFNRVPFLSLWVAGFTPIPFYPLRFLVVLAYYPVHKYLLAVFLSRAPRFFLLALMGHAFQIPDSLLALLFVALILIAMVPVIKKLIAKYQRPQIASKVLPADPEMPS